ncbi:Calcineurin subunit B [Linum grandiflorum]
MASGSSMLTQYDIEEVQDHCHNLFSQQEVVSLYQRFCQLDRNAKGFISADEFLSVPEFAVNPLSQRVLKMVDGINFKDFVAFLSAFSTKATTDQKIALIFQVYDSDGNGKVSFDDLLDVLGDLSGSFISNEQREVHSGSARIAFFFDYCCKLHYSSFCSGLFLQQVLTRVLKEAGYTKECSLLIDDFIKVRF